jgi:hypothetical protein
MPFYCNGLSRGAVVSSHHPDFDAGHLASSNSIRNLWPEGILNPENANLSHVVEDAIEVGHVLVLV